jgi:hypothetical protein
MYKIYMGLWWFCFIQWPLFLLYAWAGDNRFFNYLAESFVCKLIGLYAAYMFFLAPFMPLLAILTIIMSIRSEKGKSISKLEKWLAIGSWVLSLLVTTAVGIQGGFRT